MDIGRLYGTCMRTLEKVDKGPWQVGEGPGFWRDAEEMGGFSTMGHQWSVFLNGFLELSTAECYISLGIT